MGELCSAPVFTDAGSSPMLYGVMSSLVLMLTSVLAYRNFSGYKISSTLFPFFLLSASVE